MLVRRPHQKKPTSPKLDTLSRQTCGKADSQEDAVFFFQTGDSSIFLDKSKNACSVSPCANAVTFEPRGQESVLLNIEVKELTCANRITHKLAQVLKKMNKGIETFIQRGRKLFPRAAEAVTK